MLYRKIAKRIEEYLASDSDRMLLIDGADNLTNIPIEVKSGKDYNTFSALDKFLSNKDYNIKRAYVLSNEQKVYTENEITYMPIYYIMFFQNDSNVIEQLLD